MERRDFLRAGMAAGGSLGLGAAGCGSALLGPGGVAVPSVAELSALDMAGFLSKLDTTLGFMGSAGSVQRFVAGLTGAAAGDRVDPVLEKDDALGRKTLRAL